MIKIEITSVIDAPEILKLQKLAYRSEAEIYNDFKIPPLKQSLREAKLDFSKQTVLKAVVGDRIVGSVRAYKQAGTCFIGKLIIHPDFQNQGLGTMLIKKIETMFNDVNRYEVFTGHKSEKNLYLYQKLGYTKFKEVRIHENLSMAYLEKKNE